MVRQMGKYLSIEEYQRLNTGELTTDNIALAKLIREAEEDVDTLTFHRIGELKSLSEYQLEQIKRAVCVQTNFRYENAELLDSPLSSYGVNGVSMAFDNNKVRCVSGVYTSARAYDILLSTGFLYRGVIS